MLQMYILYTLSIPRALRTIRYEEFTAEGRPIESMATRTSPTGKPVPFHLINIMSKSCIQTTRRLLVASRPSNILSNMNENIVLRMYLLIHWYQAYFSFLVNHI